MKATIEFDLNNQEDKMAYKRANKSLDMTLVLLEITHNLRHKLENDSDIDKVFYEIYDLMEKHNIVIDELIE
jgi:hypothetical protein